MTKDEKINELLETIEELKKQNMELLAKDGQNWEIQQALYYKGQVEVYEKILDLVKAYHTKIIDAEGILDDLPF